MSPKVGIPELPSEPVQSKERIGLILRIFISLGTLSILLYSLRDQLLDVQKTLLGANFFWVLSALALSILMTLLATLRFKWVMAVQSLELPFKDLTYLNLIGYFFNNFFPTAIGGDLVRAHYVSKRTGKRMESVSAIIVDRLVGFSTLIIIILAALFLFRSQTAGRLVWWMVGGLLGIFVMLILFFGSRRIARTFGLIAQPILHLSIRQRLKRFYDTVYIYRSHKKMVLTALLWALCVHAAAFLINYIYALSLSIEISFASILMIIPLTCFASMLPSINGLGVRESAYVFFFTGTLEPEQAFALSLLWLCTLVFLSLAGGIIYMAGAGVKAQARDTEALA